MKDVDGIRIAAERPQSLDSACQAKVSEVAGVPQSSENYPELVARKACSTFELLVLSVEALADDRMALRKEVAAKSADGQLLYYAALFNKPDLAQLLLDNGADPNVVDDLGFTALHYAAALSRHAVAEVLLTGGADPNARSANGTTIVDTVADDEMRQLIAAHTTGDASA